MALVAGAVAATACRSRYVSPYCPVLERLALSVPTGHPGLVGLRIGFVSDTHLGPFVAEADLERALRLIEIEAPDLFLFGGDAISESPRYIEPAAALLGRTARGARHGAFAVLGNHDLANGAERVVGALAANGVCVLRNQSVPIAVGPETLWLVGIDDAVLGRPDLPAAFADVPDGSASLALWHEPDWAEQAAHQGAFAQLSGHSHGGQVRLPGVSPIAAPAGGRRYVAGLNHAARMPVYTSRGAGIYRPPVRFRCAPEVTLVTLVASTESGG